jgi:hypothetical protein
MTGQEFFQKLQAKLAANPAALQSAGIKGKTVSLDLRQAGAWTITFDPRGVAALAQGRSGRDCIVEMDEEPTFRKLIAGTLNVPFAVFRRAIKIQGDRALAERIGSALQRMA